MSVHVASQKPEQAFVDLTGGHATAAAVLQEVRQKLGEDESNRVVENLKELSDLTTPEGMGKAVFEAAHDVNYVSSDVAAALTSEEFRSRFLVKAEEI